MTTTRTIKDVAKDLEDAKAALKKAEAAELEEMVTSKKKYVTEKDPTGWLGYAEEVYQAFFAGYPGVAKMIERYQKQIVDRYWVMSPSGKRRTMYRVLTGSKKVIGDAKRRAVNSPIQGYSSELGVTAGYLVQKHFDLFLTKWGLPDSYFTCFSRVVHDASYSEEKYAMLLPALHINQWCATIGLHEYYKEAYGVDMILDSEIEMEIGASDARGDAWNWVLDDLPPLIIKYVDERIKDGYLAKDLRQKTLDSIFEWWYDDKKREYLLTRYPLMGVVDLDAEIKLALQKNRAYLKKGQPLPDKDKK